MFVRLAVGFLLSFAFECRSDFPDALVCRVFQVSVCPACDGYQNLCFRYEAVYLFLYSDNELGAVGDLECVCRLYFFCVASVVFRVEQSVDGVLAHDVRVSRCLFVVIGGKYCRRSVFAIHDCS